MKRQFWIERSFAFDLSASFLPNDDFEAWHPRLDRPMRVIDLAIFAAEHDDHHLARITELLAPPGQEK